MEDTLGDSNVDNSGDDITAVLILVLMEDTLGGGVSESCKGCL